jgi:pimeloyl-ACP methyl ester carboxylesterase
MGRPRGCDDAAKEGAQMSSLSSMRLEGDVAPVLPALASVAHPRRWLPIAVTGLGVMTLAVSTGIAAVANRFIDELSRPHSELDDAQLAQIGGVMGMPATLPDPPSTLQRALTFRAPKGPELRGEFWAQPRPAPTVIICHGYRTPRVRMRPVALLEYSQGFNVLTFDFRGHGESAAAATTGGVAEVHDLRAAVDLAASQPETLPGRIILHGFSMGAATALLLPPHPQVAAIIADSPYARLDDILRTLIAWQLNAESATWAPPARLLARLVPALAWTAVAVSRPLFRLRYGYALIGRPESVFKRSRRHAAPAERRASILLIHAAGDPFIPIAHARRIAAAATLGNVALETYFVEGEGHCGAYGYDPDAYVATVAEFVARAVASPSAPLVAA